MSTKKTASSRAAEIKDLRAKIEKSTGAVRRKLIARLGGLSGAGTLGRRMAAMKAGRKRWKNAQDADEAALAKLGKKHTKP